MALGLTGQKLLLNLEKLPDHPGLVKIPSLSRSLNEKVLPRVILEMRKAPEVVFEKPI
jgi:hypothetical protein